jgi:high-affinity iron transporter
VRRSVEVVGQAVHTLRGLDWVPTTSAGSDLNLGWGRWLGLYPTWEGIAAQLAALAIVYGSYALARGLQRRRRRRAINRSDSSAAGSPATLPSRSAGR